MYSFGWFSTGRDRAACELLETAWNSLKEEDVDAEFDFVFCSREPGESAESDLFMELVKSLDIPLVCYSYQRYKNGKRDRLQGNVLPRWRLEYDRQVMDRLKDFHPDLCVLAGYMLIVGEEMCRRYDMINLHPAAPGGPAGTWQEVIWQLIENKAISTGVMMHLVTPELDRGPVVAYCTFPITGGAFEEYRFQVEGKSIKEIKTDQGEDNKLFNLIRQQGLKREFPLIVSTMKTFVRGKVKISEGTVVDASGKPINGYDLTNEIDNIVEGKV
ncbi:MAG TPA: phosphoglycerate transporter [Dehalococcoidia bacterium]|nr:phosphoglycerate transporter [Dehalococcoidia bacterium]